MDEHLGDKVNKYDRKYELGKIIQQSPMLHTGPSISGSDLASDIMPWLNKQIQMEYAAGACLANLSANNVEGRWPSSSPSVDLGAALYAKDKGFI